jgi:hypothetical protein
MSRATRLRNARSKSAPPGGYLLTCSVTQVEPRSARAKPTMAFATTKSSQPASCFPCKLLARASYPEHNTLATGMTTEAGLGRIAIQPNSNGGGISRRSNGKTNNGRDRDGDCGNSEVEVCADTSWSIACLESCMVMVIVLITRFSYCCYVKHLTNSRSSFPCSALAILVRSYLTSKSREEVGKHCTRQRKKLERKRNAEDGNAESNRNYTMSSLPTIDVGVGGAIVHWLLGEAERECLPASPQTPCAQTAHVHP